MIRRIFPLIMGAVLLVGLPATEAQAKGGKLVLRVVVDCIKQPGQTHEMAGTMLRFQFNAFGDVVNDATHCPYMSPFCSLSGNPVIVYYT